MGPEAAGSNPAPGTTKGEGLDMDFIHLWCGQVGEIDALRYDKFYKDHVYVTKQYLIAEKWLNIITNPSEK